MARPVASKRPEVTGKTLRVFLYLARKGASDLRDVQRDLSFSTASLASYHLGKLTEAGYVAQNERGQYVVTKDSEKALLEGYSRVGALLVPQLFFFAVLFTGVISFFAVMSLMNGSYVLLLIATSVAMLVVLWYQTLRIWRRLASWE
jgi:DNA-binding transcriptional ArsR family regulator